MTELLIEFACAALLLATGNLFFGSVLNLKIKRAAFTALLCTLAVLLLLPFLIWGHMFLLYTVFALWVFVLFAVGVIYSSDTRPVVFWAALPVWVLGPGNILFANLLQPIAFQLWGNEQTVLIYSLKSVLLIVLNISYYAVILRFLATGAKVQMKRYANWTLALQYGLILIINALMLFSMAALCTALAARLRNYGIALLVFAWAWYGIAGVVNLLTFRMMAKISERNELAAHREQKEMEIQLNREYTAVLEHNAERLKRWQHDTNNLIAAMKLSVSDKQRAAALDELSIKIGVPAVTDYTNNVLLNQTLMLKAEEARRHDVRLVMQIALPERVPLTDIELMRIFTNLLDNAIRAAAALPEPGERVLEVVCKENAGYLYISTRNRFLEGGAPSGTGRGTEILRKFEASHQGKFTSKPCGDVWVAQLAVKL